MPSSLFDLSGRVALITGSTKGLGEAKARVLAEHGTHVIVSSRKQEICDRVTTELRDNGLNAGDMACNIEQQNAIDTAYDHIAKVHSFPDILVNDAVCNPWRIIEDTDRPLLLKA